MDKRMEETGELIKKLRKRKNMTQAELAKAIDRTESSISIYEKGKVEIPNSVLEKLAAALGVSYYALMGWEATPLFDGSTFYGKENPEFTQKLLDNFERHHGTGSREAPKGQQANALSTYFDGLTQEEIKAVDTLVQGLRGKKDNLPNDDPARED